MTTNTARTETGDTETSGAVSARYASALMTAVIRTGAPGRVIRAHYLPGSESAREGPHTCWSFVCLRVSAHQVRVFCMPTSQGVVLVIGTTDGTCRCLPTWGASAEAFGASTVAIARQLCGNPVQR
jgi:hypothetical protein